MVKDPSPGRGKAGHEANVEVYRATDDATVGMVCPGRKQPGPVDIAWLADIAREGRVQEGS
jgi:hypothetical protein